MHRDYSIADARNHLAKIVHDAEVGEPVQLTRRGKPVAVLLSKHAYDRLTEHAPQTGVWQAVQEFRRDYNSDITGFTDEDFAGLRNREDAGRDVE